MKALVHLDGRIEVSGTRVEMLALRSVIAGVGCQVEHLRPPSRATGQSPLTQRQRDILSWICAQIDANGYPPSIREIGDYFGIRSTNGVHDHMLALERKGWIKRTAETSRGLKILRRP